MNPKSLSLAAIILTALALVPAGAHLFALPNKIGMAQEPYFLVQGIYRGWALFGFVLTPAILVNFAFAFVVRRSRAFRLALLAALCLLATLIIFFTWTQPANLATEFWTVAPGNWEALKRQWEYAHATNAVLTFIALCAVTRAALTAPD
jgi:hypothetical protein